MPQTWYHKELLRIRDAVYPKQDMIEHIMHARQYIDKHYAEPLKLDEIASAAFFSKFHFIRMFRRVYGRSPNQYLTSVRIFHAKGLLRQGNCVSDVCYAVGFSSITTFTGLFRRCVGMTPAAYSRKPLQ